MVSVIYRSKHLTIHMSLMESSLSVLSCLQQESLQDKENLCSLGS